MGATIKALGLKAGRGAGTLYNTNTTSIAFIGKYYFLLFVFLLLKRPKSNCVANHDGDSRRPRPRHGPGWTLERWFRLLLDPHQ